MAVNNGFGFETTPDTYKDEWLTPPHIVGALGPFDLDPCSPIARPWPTAASHFTVHDDGLSQSWAGRVWCNPPYGPETGKWMDRMADHGNGIALIFARTETAFFQRIWAQADGFLFLFGRVRFYHATGVAGNAATAPSVLVAYGSANARILETCGMPGAFVPRATVCGTVRSHTLNLFAEASSQ